MDRECNKCIHHTGGSCSSFECNMQTLEERDKEVRGKAIEEFAEALKAKAEQTMNNPDIQLECKKCTIWRVKEIDEIAKELKGV